MAALGDITDEIRETWQLAQTAHEAPFSHETATWLASDLADALSDQLAARRKAEFWLEHDRWINCAMEPHVYCQKCGNTRETQLDPRHNWADADWQNAAKTELSGGE